MKKIKKLLQRIKSLGGRSNSGKITAPRRSNCAIKRLYRFIDYRRDLIPGSLATIVRQEYDPNRNCRISLLAFSEGLLSYIIAAENNLLGQKLMNRGTRLSSGDSQALGLIPSGSLVYNLTQSPKLPSQYVRAAGSSAILVKKSSSVSLIKLKSGEYRYFFSNTLAVLGKVNSGDYFLKEWKLAGKSRRLGFRPRTRALVKNPVDHPMGGRTKGGTPKLTPKGAVCLNSSTKQKINKLVVIKARERKKI